MSIEPKEHFEIGETSTSDDCVRSDNGARLISNSVCGKCEDSKSTIRVVKEGGLWFFERDGFKSKPMTFDEFIKLDFGEVAKQLKVDPKDVFTAWIGVTSYFNGDLATTIRRGQSDVERELKGLDLFDRLVEIRRSTVKEDDYMVKMALLHMVTAYLTEPANLGVEAPSSEGKTYPIVETARLFPQSDIWYLAGLSPTAIAHEHGVLVDAETREPIEPEILKIQARLREVKDKFERRELREELLKLTSKAAYLVDLENKILIFLDRPHHETLQKLYPILSHDVYEADYKFTDRKAKGPLKTVHVILRGWPIAIFIRTRGESTEDEWIQTVSRFTTVSPSMGERKYRAAIEFKAMLRGTPIQILNPMLGLDEELWARNALEAVKDRLIEIKRKVRAHGNPKASMFWIPFHKFIGRFFPAETGRRMRDADRFLALLQAHAAINVFSRPRLVFADGTEYVIVTREDFEEVCSLFFSEEEVMTILTGLSKAVTDFFRKVVLPVWRDKGTFTVSDLVGVVPKALDKTIGDDTIRRHYLRALKNAGFITSEPDPSDRRREIYRVLVEDVKNTSKYRQLVDAANFSLEMLREAWNELRSMSAETPDFIMCDFNGEKLSIERLYELYFKPEGGDSSKTGEEKTCHIGSGFNADIDQSPNNASFEEKTEELTDAAKSRYLPVSSLNEGVESKPSGEERISKPLSCKMSPDTTKGPSKVDDGSTGEFMVFGDAFPGYVCVWCGEEASKVVKIKDAQEAICDNCLSKFFNKDGIGPKSIEPVISKTRTIFEKCKTPGEEYAEEPVFKKELEREFGGGAQAVFEGLLKRGLLVRLRDGILKWIDR